MSESIRKPCALLRLMAERRGQKITARDVAAVQLAVRTMESQAAQLAKHFQVYGDVLHKLVAAEAKAGAMQDGLRALLEVHA